MTSCFRFTGIVLILMFALSSAHASIRCALPTMKPLFDQIREEHRGPFPKSKVEKPEAGSFRSFWLWDFSVMPPGFRKVRAKCMAVTDHCYIFVEESVIEEAFPGNTVDTIVTAFEESCPADVSRGILDIDCQIFGEPPDALDDDEHVYFLYANFAEYGHMAFDGYFNAFDQMPDDLAWQNYHQHSNEVEILYLNAMGSSGPASEYMLSVLAHEFQHLIHYRYDQLEESWLNEAMSEAAMTACGYFTDKAHLAHYCRQTARPLVDLDHPSYGAVLLFGTYLLEQFGEDGLRRLVASSKVGMASVEEVFPQLGFDELFHRWALANGGASFFGITAGQYGYRSFPLPKISTLEALVDKPLEVKIEPSGLAYIPLASEAMTMTIDSAVREENSPSKQMRRRISFNAKYEGLLPTVLLLTVDEQATPTVQELVSEDGVYEIPAGPGVVVLSTMKLGSSSFTLTLTR